MYCRRALLTAGLLCGTLATAGQAQTTTDVPDRFRLEVGGFRISADTKLTLNRNGVSNTVDFESELGLNQNSFRAYVEGYWRAGRRHLVSVSYQRLNRETGEKVLERTIEWGGQTFPVGATAQAFTHSDYISGAYRFALHRSDRFEIGPAVGIGFLKMSAGISAQGTGAEGRDLDASAGMDTPTGDLGAYAYFWPARRVLVRTDFRYIFVKPENAEASVTEARGSVLWHPVRQLGVGLQYSFSNFRYDRDIVDTSLGGSTKFYGGQLVVSYAF
jgi:hypothetical protein